MGKYIPQKSVWLPLTYSNNYIWMLVDAAHKNVLNLETKRNTERKKKRIYLDCITQ
jgi:hypothetical protein